jgi:hypothetical protein
VGYLIFYAMVHVSTKFETFAAFFTCTPKIYVVCLLTVLSARLKLREERSNAWVSDWGGVQPVLGFQVPT